MLAAWFLATALSGTLELSDRCEMRLRDPGDVTGTPSLDLETEPRGLLAFASRRARFAVSYSPRLTLWNTNVDPSPTLLQVGTAHVDFRNRLVEWRLDERASYGGLNLTSTSLVPSADGTPNKLDIVPVSRVIRYGSSTSVLGARVAKRRWASDLSVGYQLSGSADSSDRSVLPLQYGPFAEAKFDFAMTRRAHALTTIDGSNTEFSSGSAALIVEGTEGWRYAASRTTTLRLDLGAAETRTRSTAATSYSFVADPVAAAVWEQRYLYARDRVTSELSLRVSPVVNAVLGSADERAQATLRAGWTRERWQVDASLSAQQTVQTSDPNAVRLLAGELRGSHPVSRSLAVDAGVRALAQRLNVPVAPGSNDSNPTSFAQAIVFVGLEMKAAPMRL